MTAPVVAPSSTNPFVFNPAHSDNSSIGRAIPTNPETWTANTLESPMYSEHGQLPIHMTSAYAQNPSHLASTSNYTSPSHTTSEALQASFSSGQSLDGQIAPDNVNSLGELHSNLFDFNAQNRYPLSSNDGPLPESTDIDTLTMWVNAPVGFECVISTLGCFAITDYRSLSSFEEWGQYIMSIGSQDLF